MLMTAVYLVRDSFLIVSGKMYGVRPLRHKTLNNTKVIYNGDVHRDKEYYQFDIQNNVQINTC